MKLFSLKFNSWQYKNQMFAWKVRKYWLLWQYRRSCRLSTQLLPSVVWKVWVGGSEINYSGVCVTSDLTATSLPQQTKMSCGKPRQITQYLWPILLIVFVVVYFYLIGRDRYRDIFHLLVCSPSASNSHVWPGQAQVCHVGDREASIWAVTCFFPGCTSPASWNWSRAGLETRLADRGWGCHNQVATYPLPQVLSLAPLHLKEFFMKPDWKFGVL